MKETVWAAVTRLRSDVPLDAEKTTPIEAVSLLDRAESLIHPEALPYAMVSRDNSHDKMSMVYLEAAYKAGHTALVSKLETALRKDYNDQLNYYKYLRDSKPEYFNGDLASDEAYCMQALKQLDDMKKQYSGAPVNVIEKPGQQPPTDSLNKK